MQCMSHGKMVVFEHKESDQLKNYVLKIVRIPCLLKSSLVRALQQWSIAVNKNCSFPWKKQANDVI